MNYGNEQSEDDILKQVQKTPDLNLMVQQVFQNMKEMVFGAGTTVIKGNKEGFFVGGASFTDAPFSVSYAGALKATAGTISGTFLVTGALIAGDPNGENATFGSVAGKGAGVFFNNGTSYQGAAYFASNGSIFDSTKDVIISCGHNKSIGFEVDGNLICYIDKNGFH